MTPTTSSPVHRRLTVSQAAAAARDGRLDRAAQLLEGLADGADPTVLDLRARIHAQRGELDAAERCWGRVLDAVPEHSAALAGRDTITRITQGHIPTRPRISPNTIVALLGAVVVVLVVVAGGLVFTGDKPRGAEPVTAGPASETRRPDSPPQQPAAPAAPNQLDRDLDTISAAVTLPGVISHRRTTDIEVVLDAGAFESGTQITASAADLLTEIGRRLTGLPVTLTVVGHTVAVPGGPQTGGSTVGWDRAAIAAGCLAAGSGLPLTNFALTSADQRDNPFSDPNRNRTVTVLVRPVR